MPASFVEAGAVCELVDVWLGRATIGLSGDRNDVCLPGYSEFLTDRGAA